MVIFYIVQDTENHVHQMGIWSLTKSITTKRKQFFLPCNTNFRGCQVRIINADSEYSAKLPWTLLRQLHFCREDRKFTISALMQCTANLQQIATSLNQPFVYFTSCHFLNGPTPASCCLFLFFFKHKFYIKNCRRQQDSNSDCRSLGQAR